MYIHCFDQNLCADHKISPSWRTDASLLIPVGIEICLTLTSKMIFIVLHKFQPT